MTGPRNPMEGDEDFFLPVRPRTTPTPEPDPAQEQADLDYLRRNLTSAIERSMTTREPVCTCGHRLTFHALTSGSILNDGSPRTWGCCHHVDCAKPGGCVAFQPAPPSILNPPERCPACGSTTCEGTHPCTCNQYPHALWCGRPNDHVVVDVVKACATCRHYPGSAVSCPHGSLDDCWKPKEQP